MDILYYTGEAGRRVPKNVSKLLPEDHRANATLKNKDGETPLDAAIRRNNQSVGDFFTNYKKQTNIAQMAFIQDATKRIMSVVTALNTKPSFEKRLLLKVQSIIDQRCEETIVNIQDKMNQSLEESTRQLTYSNGEVATCVSSLSTMVEHLNTMVVANEAKLNDLTSSNGDVFKCVHANEEKMNQLTSSNAEVVKSVNKLSTTVEHLISKVDDTEGNISHLLHRWLTRKEDRSVSIESGVLDAESMNSAE